MKDLILELYFSLSMGWHHVICSIRDMVTKTLPQRSYPDEVVRRLSVCKKCQSYGDEICHDCGCLLIPKAWLGNCEKWESTQK